MNLKLLYRGPLSSCNYACDYCPFAKRTETPAQLAKDRADLERFLTWIHERTQDRFGILFTPWGEALVRPWYQAALIRLTQLPHVDKAAIQTNLSCKLNWVEDCDKTKLALWCTYHPGETTRPQFLAKCHELLQRGVRFSVGVVGLKEHLPEIQALRAELPPEVYLWVNAYKREANYYSPELLQSLEAVDPLFPVNNQYHASRGEPCRAGKTVLSVDGDGLVRRCHFIAEPIGILYDANFEQCLQDRLCPNATCGCHIGYVHLDKLKLDQVYGDGILERIPLPQARERKSSRA